MSTEEGVKERHWLAFLSSLGVAVCAVWLQIATQLLWCWRRLLRVSWTARRSNQSILKEINPENPLEGLMLKPPDVKSQLTRKDPDAGKNSGQEEKGPEDEMVRWHHLLSGHKFEQTLEDGEGQESLVCCSPWGCRVGHDLVTKQ